MFDDTSLGSSSIGMVAFLKMFQELRKEKKRGREREYMTISNRVFHLLVEDQNREWSFTLASVAKIAAIQVRLQEEGWLWMAALVVAAVAVAVAETCAAAYVVAP